MNLLKNDKITDYESDIFTSFIFQTPINLYVII